MILLTGAAGKTGRAILDALTTKGVRVKSLVRNVQQAEEIKNFHSAEVVIADLRDVSALDAAMNGVSKIYYICPNMAPDELEIGRKLISLAQKNGVKRFVYHSVLHPQVEAMAHHWQKMRMEEALFTSGLDFTILQPCAYMQNTLSSVKAITEQGIYSVPYATSARISVVDLQDVAQAAETVLTQLNHSNAIYELAGPEPLSQDEVARAFEMELGRTVKAVSLDRAQWLENSRKSSMDERHSTTLINMFEYYENYGLVGNANVLTYLLKRPPTRFAEFGHRAVNNDPRMR